MASVECQQEYVCNGYKENGKGWVCANSEAVSMVRNHGVDGVWVASCVQDRLWESWMERLVADGVKVESSKAVDDYLGQRRDKGGLQGSNLAFEFLWDNRTNWR